MLALEGRVLQMPEIILTLFLVGAITGIIYSMPIAGPISIIVVSRAFQGKVRFCLRTALGSATIESIYVFIVVYGIAALYELYRPILPYFLFTGAVFIIIVGQKIRKQKIDLNSLESKMIITDKYENRGGLRTGIAINLTNPTLLINWFIASFITLSFVSSIGLNIGGLDLILNQNIISVSEITGAEFQTFERNDAVIENKVNKEPDEHVTPLVMSLAFALGVGVGVYIWLHILTKIIIKYREKIKTSVLDKLISGLGILLIFIGIYLGYRAVNVLIG
jgi:threonine/homoserine/homoserine lactone efflux protein